MKLTQYLQLAMFLNNVFFLSAVLLESVLTSLLKFISTQSEQDFKFPKWWSLKFLLTLLSGNYASANILGFYYEYSFIIHIKYEELSTISSLYFVQNVFFCYIVEGSCVSDHNCMFTCQRNGAIFILSIEDGSLFFVMWYKLSCTCRIMEHSNKPF